MKRAIFVICLCLLAGGCTSREVIEDADPASEQEQIILTLAEEPIPCIWQPASIQKELPKKVEQKVYRDIPLSHDLQDAADKVCEEYNVPPEVLFAVMEVESSYQVDARNGQCIGLMQIHTINLPYLQEKIGVDNLSDPVQNIRAGAYLLGGYLQKYSLSDSLMAYNLGEGGAKKQWAQGIHETAYTRKVLAAMEGSDRNGSF